MAARQHTDERSEFDPVAEHGSSPDKPLHRSDKPVDKLKDTLGKLGGKETADGSGPHDGTTHATPVQDPHGAAAGGHQQHRAGAPVQGEPHAGAAGGHQGHQAGGQVQGAPHAAEPAAAGGPQGQQAGGPQAHHAGGHQAHHGDAHAGTAVHPGDGAAAQQPGDVGGPYADPSAERMAPEQPMAEPMHGGGVTGDRSHAPGRHAGEALAERVAGRDGHGGAHTGADHHGRTGAHAAGHGEHGGSAPVLGQQAGMAEQRLHEAVSHFVDDPRRSVEAADALLAEISQVFTETLAERHRALRDTWHGRDASSDTEHLRASLQDYRDLVDRLLRV